MTEAGVTALLAVVAVGLLVAMRAGWLRQRAATLAAVVEPAPVPEDGALGAVLAGPVEATYVSTTFATDSFARVVAHDLGVRSPARVEVRTTGVVVRRTGAPDLFVPAGALDDVGGAAGMAGKVVGGQGLLVLAWRLGDVPVRTGLRTRFRADQGRLTDAARTLVPTGTGPSETPTPTTDTEEQR